MHYHIRPERPADAGIIRQVIEAAFAVAEHSDGTEGAIVDALRAAGALSVSLVATVADQVVGHVAFSPITLDGADLGWFGLGPVSVRPDLHGQGIGAALIRAGLAQLKAQGARGCVVLGDPRYYPRFGFAVDPAIQYEGVPPEYFMALSLDGSRATGMVAYHTAFSAS
ncbi:putative acetyltransferase [Pseudomonas nitritireducens]|uniref:Putative acetyltransferase n=1 Tax=Pseudomonas nitroreducens TaxID=46680 RepID=A0A7W7KS14_PSENT|nr:N-acetyltransferase [Pseudomonas nitritireducens]MBB4867899.1 putative acetyltransferase [Pseudomonas nitritireducens]